ncbi:hypothetical protein ALQ80_200065 [Pseudomonas coronafaciens pv. oryzae]|nr:hypothetical protein ALQ80_200065 [Pseudomonas coronafaciens pv. oryzae]
MRFNVAQLDTEPTEFDLIVVASQILDITVCQPTPQIAAPIHPRRRVVTETVFHESLRGQRITIQIAASELYTRDVNLAAHANRDRLHMRVQQIQPGIGDGPANRHDPRMQVGHAVPVGDVDSGFSRAIQVMQLHMRKALLEVLLQTIGQRLAATEHLPQCATCQRANLIEEALQHGGYKMQYRHSRACDQLGQILGVLMACRTCDHQLRTGEQRKKKLPDRHVKPERCLLQEAVFATQPIVVLRP